MQTKKTHTILVVDDDEEIGFMLKLMLEHRSYSVIVSKRAENLEAIIHENNIALVVLDMLIADAKGTDVCAALKSNAAIAIIPILMMTALPGMEKDCKTAGANDFISKPFEMADFVSKVNALLIIADRQ